MRGKTIIRTTLMQISWEFLQVVQGQNLTEHQIDILADSLCDLWENGDPHNSMELSSGIVNYLLANDARKVLEKALPRLQEQSNYQHEVANNSANHCLISALEKVGLWKKYQTKNM